MNIIKKFFNSDYIFSAFSKGMGVVIAVVYSVFYNRYLGAELKGEAAIILNYVSLISSILCLGMYQAYPFFKKIEQDVFYPFVNTMTSLYLILFGASGLIFIFAPVNINLKIAMLMVPIQSYIRHINYVVTIENPRKRNISSILINIFDLALVVMFWCFTEATYGYLVIILIVQTIFNLILSYANLKTSWKKFRFTLKLVPKYAKYGIIPMITLFLMTINYRIDVLMLENMGTVALSEIGIYSVGVSLAEKVWLIPDSIKDILLSKLCRGKGENEVAKIIRVSLAITLIFVVIVALVGPYFVKYVYGEEYIGADTITTIMLIGVIGMIFYKMVYSYNIANGHRIISLIFLGIAAVLNLIGNVFFIPIAGIYGAAWCSVISYTVCGVCFLVYFKMKSKISFRKIVFITSDDLNMAKKLIKK